jgi:RNA polymerase sigma factor (sigma-70 family)
MNARRELARLDDDQGREGSGAALAAPRAEGQAVLGPEGWAPLIAQHQHRVVLALIALGCSFERATELAHEAWARLMEQERQGRLGELKLPGLAIVQARFLAWDEWRREAMVARHDASGARAAEPALVELPADPEQRLLSRQQAQRALDAVASAPVSSQRLFRLLYADPGMPHARAAEALGLSVQRVRQLLCELRKRVRAAIEGDPS